MKMQKILNSIIISGFCLTAFTVSAASFPELKSKLDAARTSLVEMMGGKKDEGQQKLVKDSANAVSTLLESMKAPAGKEAQFSELKSKWQEFKKTREDELVPKILAGKIDEARAIATGIQKERLEKMQSLIRQLQGGDL